VLCLVSAPATDDTSAIIQSSPSIRVLFLVSSKDYSEFCTVLYSTVLSGLCESLYWAVSQMQQPTKNFPFFYVSFRHFRALASVECIYFLQGRANILRGMFGRPFGSSFFFFVERFTATSAGALQQRMRDYY
jgi:hypothetical protein